MSRFVLTAQLQLQAPNNVAQVVRQIQSQLNGVTVNLQVQGAPQAQRQIQQVTQNVQQATTAAERMGRAFAVSVRRFAAFSIATRAVGLFTSTLSDAVQTAINFERQLIKVSQVTGKSISQLKNLTNEITNLSTGLGVSSDSLLEVSTVLAQAGLSANDTKVALNALAKAALAPNFDSISETAEGAIAILAQFQEGVGALEKQLGSINAVAGAFAVEASDLIDVVRRTGGVFKASGGNLNELLALFTSVRATTRESAESIGTGLRTIFTRIQRPKTIEFLKQFGVELVDLEGKFVGPYEAIRRLSEALSGLGEGDITFIRIAEELGGFRQIGKVLPLLQQFATAEAALNVATKANNSLTSDAVSAQAALAIRIMKVREEFLALIRSITETSTFQIFANTALSLASALIKLADSIKPLLPLLAGMAAIKLTKGIGGFLGGIGGGLTSGRTFNQGGRVHRFARGGVVPGTGNRDTVPAMLTPGEFVIRKSSVNRLGASNLAAMNENKYAEGGKIQIKPGAIGGFFLQPEKGSDRPQQIDTAINVTGSKALSQLGLINPNDPKVREQAFLNSTKAQQEKILGTKLGGKKISTPTVNFSGKSKSVFTNDGSFASKTGVNAQAGADDRLTKRLKKGSIDLSKTDYAKSIPLTGTLNTYFPGGDDLVNNSQVANIVAQQTQSGLQNAVVNSILEAEKAFSNTVISPNQQSIQAAASRISKDANARATTEGFIFEGIIQGLTGARLAGNQSSFDFPFESISRSKPALKAMFTNSSGEGIDSLEKADAKRSNTPDAIKSIINKITNDINKGNLIGVQLQKFATGGGVGTDTVPALLTPGEFVVNRSSAQRIGYGNLNRMNKVGKYAKGGVVQHFAAGTSGSGAKPILSNFAVPGFDAKAPTMLNKIIAKLTGTFSIFDVSLNDGRKRFNALQNNIPGLSKAIINYANATNLTVKETGQLATAYHNMALTMHRQGATNDQIIARMQPYIQALEADTNAKLNAAKATATASAATTKSPVPTGPMPMGAPGSIPGMSTGSRSASTTAPSKKSGGIVGTVQDNKLFAASMVSGIVQGFLPAIDENSTALLKLTHGFLGLVTTITSVGFALEMFGAKLTVSNIMDFLKGGPSKLSKVAGIQAGRGMLAAGRGLTSVGMPTFGKMFTSLAGITAKVVGGFTAMLGPLVAITGSAWAATAAFKASIEAIYDFEGRLNRAIKSGDVEQAKSVANEKATFEGANAVRGMGALGGAAIGGILGGPVGAAIGAALGAAVGTLAAQIIPEGLLDAFNEAFGGNTRASVVALAAAQAGAVKTQKALDSAQKIATNAMEDFEKGSISASDALSKIRASASEVATQENRASDFAMKNLGNRASDGFTGRNVASALTLGYVESSTQRNARLGQQSAEQIKQASQFQSQAFQMESGARSATIRSGFARNKDKDEIRQEAMGDLQSRRSKLLVNAAKADAAGDEQSAKAFREAALQMEEQMKQVEREMASLEKEVARAKAAFEAMDLGLRGPTATATAMSASMNKFAAGLEVGGSQFVTNTEFLSEAMSSAAQAMDPDEIKSAIGNVRQNLEKMGISGTYADKFEANTNAFIQAQQNYNKAFQNIKSKIPEQDFKQLSPEKLKDEFAKELTAGLGKDAKENLTAIIQNMELSQSEVDDILGGNLQAFGDKLGEAGKKQFEEIMKIAQERQKAEQVIINLTKQRADAERNLLEAQRQAIDLKMEGREIQGKYGGKAVTPEERRKAILDKANVPAGAKKLGLSDIGANTTLADLKTRREEIAKGFGEIEANRSVQGGMSGISGTEADDKQKNLDAAFKNQIQTVRDLIKVEEEQLKITQEKNKLEKESLESLINGDIEKFFDQQAAVGATAAIATGNQDLMNAFGATALSGAYSNIQRQKEAGVQEIYGQRIEGPGGLGEQAAGAALGARGVQNPMAVQMLAGTTPEEEASRQRLRGLGEELGQLGGLGEQMAQMQFETADMNVKNATINLEKIDEHGKKAADEANAAIPAAGADPAAAMRTGGIVYASRGIFVPRGTDTVPAMLTPGEFVVRREAVNRGNNLQMLQAMNNGMSGSAGAAAGVQNFARGGKVQYLSNGGLLNGIVQNILGTDVISLLTKALTTFTSQMSDTIKSLQDTKFKITLDSTNVNVNLSGNSGMLAGLTQEARNEIAKIVSDKIKNTSVGSGGKLVENTSTMPKG